MRIIRDLIFAQKLLKKVFSTNPKESNCKRQAEGSKLIPLGISYMILKPIVLFLNIPSPSASPVPR